MAATRASPLTTWRHPKARPTRSFSNDEIPSPMPPATAIAAGTKTTVSDGVKLPVQPWVVA